MAWIRTGTKDGHHLGHVREGVEIVDVGVPLGLVLHQIQHQDINNNNKTMLVQVPRPLQICADDIMTATMQVSSTTTADTSDSSSSSSNYMLLGTMGGGEKEGEGGSRPPIFHGLHLQMVTSIEEENGYASKTIHQHPIMKRFLWGMLLLHELYLDEDSFYYPYFQTLPGRDQFEDDALNWTPAIRQLAEGVVDFGFGASTANANNPSKTLLQEYLSIKETAQSLQQQFCHRLRQHQQDDDNNNNN